MTNNYKSKYMVRLVDYKGTIHHVLPENVLAIRPVLHEHWPEVDGEPYVGQLTRVDLPEGSFIDFEHHLIKGSIGEIAKRIDDSLDLTAGVISEIDSDESTVPPTNPAPAGSSVPTSTGEDEPEVVYKSRHFIRLTSSIGYPTYLNPAYIAQVRPYRVEGWSYVTTTIQDVIDFEGADLNVFEGGVDDILRAMDVHTAARLGHESASSKLNEVVGDGKPFKLTTEPAPASED